MTAASFRHRVTRASVWTICGFGTQKVLQLGSNLILTRLLFPEAFGLMALANVLLIGLAMFSDVGIKPAIVQSSQGEEEAFLNTAWTIQILRGFILWAVACLLAWPMALLYHQPILFPLLCALGSTAAINGLATTALASGERKLHLGRLTVVQLIGQAVSLVVTALLAWYLRSVWALAYGAVAGAALSVALGHLLMPSHPHRLQIDRKAAGALLGFGRWIFLSTLVTYVGGQGLRAIQGILLPVDTIGVLSIAQTFAWMPGDLVGQLLASVGFPALAEKRNSDPDAFERVVHQIRTRLLAASLPMFIGLSLISGPLIDILYDHRYAAAGQYLAILSLTGTVGVIAMAYQNAYLALGMTRTYFISFAIFMAARIIGLVIGQYVGNVEGMLIGIGLGSLVGYVYTAITAQKLRIFSLALDSLAFAIVALTGLCVWFLYF